MTTHRQQGVVLVVALIMMAVIGVSSAIALKSALSQDQVSANQRARSLALQAAEAALRYCESSVTATNLNAAQLAVPRAAPVEADAEPVWAQEATWVGPSAAVAVVPPAFVFDGSNLVYNRRPECMVQQVSLSALPGLDPKSPIPEAYVITARGFSPDYAESANRTPVSGAAVWLQSSVQIIP